MTNDTVKKLYVDDHGMVTCHCPKCGESERQSAERFKDIKGPVKIICICGNVYEVMIEFRRFYRKDTKLEGIYQRTSFEGHWGKVIVRNVSSEGCKFELTRKENLAKGEEIKIEFTLDNPRQSLIRKKAIVSVVEGSQVGCKFIEPPGYIDTELAFYLRRP
jgi:PilZ domain